MGNLKSPIGQTGQSAPSAAKCRLPGEDPPVPAMSPANWGPEVLEQSEKAELPTRQSPTPMARSSGPIFPGERRKTQRTKELASWAGPGNLGLRSAPRHADPGGSSERNSYRNCPGNALGSVRNHSSTAYQPHPSQPRMWSPFAGPWASEATPDRRATSHPGKPRRWASGRALGGS